MGRQSSPIRRLHGVTAALILFIAPIVLGCAAQPAGRNEAPAKAETSDCTHCNDAGPAVANLAESLSPVQRGCGLTVADVRDSEWVALAIDDPRAEQKLGCLADAGDHEVVGRFSRDLMWARRSLRPADADARAYRWGMVALKTYLRSVGIDYDRDDFFDAYRRLGERPGPVNANGPSDNIYYYSDVQRELVASGRIRPTPADARKLRTLEQHRPDFG